MTVFGKNRHREYSFAKLLSRVITRSVRVKEECDLGTECDSEKQETGNNYLNGGLAIASLIPARLILAHLYFSFRDYLDK